MVHIGPPTQCSSNLGGPEFLGECSCSYTYVHVHVYWASQTNYASPVLVGQEGDRASHQLSDTMYSQIVSCKIEATNPIINHINM